MLYAAGFVRDDPRPNEDAFMSILYHLLRPLLFRVEPERAHRIAMSLYGMRARLGRAPTRTTPTLTVGSLRVPNHVGLAAGFDKNGVYIDLAAHMGFGFIEIGTITPRPQPGNPQPRIFRYPEHGALVNRMGFPNDGVEAISQRVERSRSNAIKGANISKNFDTPLAAALDDFVTCYRRVRRWADYVVINVSSPNTPGLRDLQSAEFLATVADAFHADGGDREIPLLLKVSPDLTEGQMNELANFVRHSSVAGVIATNTTVDRSEHNAIFQEAGGISGTPVFERAVRTVAYLRERIGREKLLIGCGGIMSAADAIRMRTAGADLVQIYTGLIYRGPQLVHEIATALREP